MYLLHNATAAGGVGGGGAFPGWRRPAVWTLNVVIALCAISRSYNVELQEACVLLLTLPSKPVLACQM